MVLFLIILLVISIPSNWLDWFVELKDLNKDNNKLIRVFRMFLFHIGKLSNTSPSWAFSMFRLWAKQCWTGSGTFHANYSFRQRHLKTRLIYAVIFLKSEYTDSTFELVLWTCKSPYRRIRNERYSPAFFMIAKRALVLRCARRQSQHWARGMFLVSSQFFVSSLR